MRAHTLTTEQIICASIEDCWAFFSNPSNLSKITPPRLDFQIRSELAAEIHAGMLITYSVRPLLGVRVKWVSEITGVVRLRSFVDEQRAGPYRLWRHEHFFEPLGEGRVRVRDRVRYAMPFGIAGEIVHAFWVKRELGRIFAYREVAVRRIFGADPRTD